MTTEQWQAPLTLEDRLAELAKARAELMAVLENTPAEPETGTSDRWSVAEIVYHLHLAEKSITRMLQKAIRSGPRQARASEEFLRTEWERIRSLVGSREHPATAPPAALPTDAPPLAEALARLNESRRELLELLGTVSLDDLASVSMPHPFEAIGTVTGAGWLSIIAQHELRHAEQIREITSRRK
ncbi:MAG TPA: DinB family protein [Blastocatellia bacterium]|nr:DinB family protein [Blastocatellia bacterium]